MEWPSSEELLKLAVYLSSLDYYLGILLFSAPLPAQFKRFGLRMAYHGAVSALLASLYATIIYAAEFILSSLGVSWNSLEGFYTQATGYSAAFYAFAAGVTVGSSYLLGELPKYLKKLGSFIATSVVKSVAKASMLIAVSEAAVKVVASFTLLYWPLLLLIGIVLYSIPAGVGRRLGASLIASALVLYLGLPLLPYWVDMWLYAAKNANPVAGLIIGGSAVPVYMLWGHVKGVFIVGGGSVSVVLWKGGVPNGYQTSGEYHFLYPLVPGGYRLSVYVGPLRVWDKVITIPDECISSPFTTPSILEMLEVLFGSLLKGGLKPCRYDIDLQGRVAIIGDHVVVIADRGVYIEAVRYNSTNSDHIDVKVLLGGSGYATICCGCGCTGFTVNVTSEAEYRRGCAVCSRVRIDRVEWVEVRAEKCSSKISGAAPRGGLETSLLTLVLHDIPLAFYTIALAYAISVWSYLALLSLAIYGFGRVFGESSVLVVRLRY